MALGFGSLEYSANRSLVFGTSLIELSDLERCDNPTDWFQREIEEALDTKKRIGIAHAIPVLFARVAPIDVPLHWIQSPRPRVACSRAP